MLKVHHLFAAFSHTQIPAQQWVRDAASATLRINSVPPVRSMLGWSFTHRNAPSVNLCKCVHSSASALENLEELQGMPPPQPIEPCRHKFAQSHQESLSPWVSGFTCFGDGKREIPSVDSHVDLSAFNEPSNIFGCMSDDDQHIAEVIVDLLGPRSYSGESYHAQALPLADYLTLSTPSTADILLSHAIVNGNGFLVNSLLSLDVCLTLNHFKLALKVSPQLFFPYTPADRRLCVRIKQVGYALPVSLEMQIEAGAPFRSSFGSLDQEPDLRSKPKLS